MPEMTNDPLAALNTAIDAAWAMAKRLPDGDYAEQTITAKGLRDCLRDAHVALAALSDERERLLAADRAIHDTQVAGERMITETSARFEPLMEAARVVAQPCDCDPGCSHEMIRDALTFLRRGFV